VYSGESDTKVMVNNFVVVGTVEEVGPRRHNVAVGSKIDQ